jgi:hypothetical protein
MGDLDEIWFPLVDEPIGSIVQEIEGANAEIGALVGTPHRILAFRTFAYLRVGILLGQLLVERDIQPDSGSATWVDQLMQSPETQALVVAEVRSVAEEIAADPRYAGDEQLGPDEGARERFREFARRRLEAT